MLCFFAAAIFWIFNALNKDYATNLTLPLRIEFDSSRYMAVEPLPTDLLLNVSGNGWEIFRKSLGFKVPNISLPLDRPAETHKIVASSLSPLVASQVEALKLNFMVTDTLRISIEPKLSRKLKLIPFFDRITFKDYFGKTGPAVVFPDSVLLEGPRSIIERLADTLSIHPKASRVGSNFKESAEVLVSNKGLIKRNPPIVEVSFDVGIIEAVIINAKLTILKGTGVAQADKDSVQCIFRVPQRERDSFRQETAGLTATINAKDLKKGDVKTILPSLNKNFSANIELVQIDSVRVKKY